MKTNLKWGDRVITTKKAIEKNIFPKHQKGIYLGESRTSLSIVVVCMRQKTPGWYYSPFWKKDE